MLAPRSLVRLLREGEQALVEQRYADAILTLGAILDDDNPGLPEDLRGQDFFVGPSVRGRYFQTVKSEARRLLGDLGDEAREILEIEYGIPARNALDKALENRDLKEVARVARRYSHTLAGYDAQLLVARQKLAEGLPLAAASLLDSMVTFPAARERYGPELSRLAAICWMMAGRGKCGRAGTRGGRQLFSRAVDHVSRKTHGAWRRSRLAGTTQSSSRTVSGRIEFPTRG